MVNSAYISPSAGGSKAAFEAQKKREEADLEGLKQQKTDAENEPKEETQIVDSGNGQVEEVTVPKSSGNDAGSIQSKIDEKMNVIAGLDAEIARMRGDEKKTAEQTAAQKTQQVQAVSGSNKNLT